LHVGGCEARGLGRFDGAPSAVNRELHRVTLTRPADVFADDAKHPEAIAVDLRLLTDDLLAAGRVLKTITNSPSVSPKP
jgi:hypothetical protein